MNQYILVYSEEIAKIKHEALQKLAANKERPLSEASIEARSVLQVVNYLFEHNRFDGWWETEEKTPETVAYETGWKDGYEEGMYDGMYK